MRLSEEELVSALREEREEVDPGFAAALDEWAAAGFPRAERPRSKRSLVAAAGGDAAGPIERLRTRLASTPPRRLLAPAGAALTLIVVAGVAISQSGNYGGGDPGLVATQAAPSSGSGDLAAPENLDSRRAPAPPVDGTPEKSAESTALREQLSNRDAQAAFDRASAEPLAAGSNAPGRTRHVAQNVDLTLASEPQKVREVADGVNEVINRYRGFVLNSSVQSGDDSRGVGARFQVKIPARSLQAALADLSELAHVQSRTEGTIDITSRFVSAQERIDENETARQSLLNQLESATTETEIDAIRAQLRTVNAQLAAARNDLAEAQDRVQLVPVTVSIVSDANADEDGNWSIGDALDDAGQVLSTAAGIAVVAGAVLLPLALVGLIFGLALRAWASRSRERALDG